MLEMTTPTSMVNTKKLKRINRLVKDALRQPFESIGKPEPLKESLLGNGPGVSMTLIGGAIALKASRS